MSASDGDVLFSNDILVIGMLQAVSGGATVAALAQAQTIIDLFGYNAFRIFFTLTVVALIAAVVAAYARAGRYPAVMKRTIVLSLASLSIALIVLVAFLWTAEAPSDEDDDQPVASKSVQV